MNFIPDYLEIGLLSLLMTRFMLGWHGNLLRYVWNLSYSLIGAFMFYQVLPHHMELTYIVICLLGIATGKLISDKSKLPNTLLSDIVCYFLIIVSSSFFWTTLVLVRPYLIK